MNPLHVHADTSPSPAGIRSVDVMKYSKDVMNGQPSDADIDSLVGTLKSTNITHIALSVPLDATTDYPADMKPSPRTAEAFTQKWADAIHARGLKIIWRGTFSGIEGLYNFAKRVGSNRFAAGTAASAASDGQSSWLGRIYQYITGHSSYFADGDVWAPLPERTEGIFSDATSFLPYGGVGIQATYAAFMNDLKLVSNTAFAAAGKRVITGLTANNFSEIVSTWIPKSVFDTAGYASVDYYGTTHTPAEMDHDLRAIAASTGKQVFLQEWGDYWNQALDQGSRSAYLQSMYDEMNILVRDKVLIGFNSWAGWANTAEGILVKDATGFRLNYAGTILANFFATGLLASIAQAAVPPPAPAPVPSSTPVSCPQAAYAAFTGCYYKNQDLTSLAMTRKDAAVNFDWNNLSPDPAIPNDHFSARWEGTFPFATANYTFTAAADDGVRVYVDNQLLMNYWVNQAASPSHSAVKYIASGNHIVRVEYFENTGGAVAKVSWK